MKIFFKILSILLITMLIYSCEKDSRLVTPDYTPRLVIHSYISPSDTILRVHVSTNKNIYGEVNEYPKALPVEVTLTDGDKAIKFSPSDTFGFCTVKYNVFPGHQYKLTARCKGYPDISAVCNIPDLNNNMNIVIDTSTEISSYNAQRLKVLLKFEDLPNEKNFYSSAAILIYSYRDNPYYGEFYGFLYPLNKKNEEIRESVVYSDYLMDGQEFVHSFRGNVENNPTLIPSKVIVNVLEIDNDYYLHETSLKTYKGTEDSLTEFSPLYTNVTGGYGIFASYIKYEKIFKWK